MGQSGLEMNAFLLRAVCLAASVLAPLASGGPASAQPVNGSASAGRRTAAALCMQCHSIRGRTNGARAPSFEEVANLSSTTPLSLKVFLRSNHNRMPDLIIPESDTDDLIAFILSLRS